MKQLLFCLIFAPVVSAAQPFEMKLWSEGVPGKMQPASRATREIIHSAADKAIITDIHEPAIAVYLPDHPLGIGVVVAPGGGYAFLSVQGEGAQVCEQLSEMGITAILLKYRIPTRDEANPHEKPVQDAARAIALVRKHALEWKVSMYRVGLLGFGSSGNLLLHLTCDCDGSDMEAKANVPNFGILINGAGVADLWEPDKPQPGFIVPEDAPPMFRACGADGEKENAVASATALCQKFRRKNIPAEVHVFRKHNRNTGMREADEAMADWLKPCLDWMSRMGSFMNVETLKKEIARREQGLQDIIRILQRCFPCGNDAIDSEARLRAARRQLVVAQEVGKKEAAEKASATIKKEEALLKQLTQPVIEGVSIETISQDILRLKKEKLELEAELQKFESMPNPTPP